MKYLIIPIIFILGYTQNLYGQNREDTISIKSNFWGVKHYQSDKKLSSFEIKMLYDNHPKSSKLYRMGTSSNIISGIFGFIGGFTVARAAFGEDLSDNSRTIGYAISAVSIFASLMIDSNGNSQKKLAAKLYNDSIVKYGESDKKMKINLVVTDQLGIGLRLGL